MSLWRSLLVAVLCWGAFAYSGLRLHDHERLDQRLEVLRVRLPLLVQLLYSGGDSYLAANLNVFRSVVVDAAVTERETYRIQGQLQADAARFNPLHEDNYYLAAAILPWNGQVEAGQEVLLKAAQARTWDMWPAFYYAFNAMYFERDMLTAGEWAEIAAQRSPKNAPALRSMAAAWYERQNDSAVALDVLRNMHAQSTDKDFRLLLQARIARLEGLLVLRAALADYRQQHQGKLPTAWEQLIGYGGLEVFPEDPLGKGYMLDASGELQVADHIDIRKQE
ncbi:hypothetical protein [Pseudomonas sp.]|uniref:hypothetical protein n=1 Tax=Pseudomonas sp. TaxID=306 RepID=UPI0039828962